MMSVFKWLNEIQQVKATVWLRGDPVGKRLYSFIVGYKHL